ncbi:MAG: hypothetical protein ONB05_04720 [candidate division KSB1 bacterium]|nr:hypothetical protein [candidate division KSB1 bacterium]
MKEKEFFRWFSLYDRCRQRVTIDKGEIQYFVVQYESYIENKWVPIVRYDTAHRFFHKDIINPDGTKTRKTFYLELNEALTFAEVDIKNNWQQYKSQYLEKMKND